MLQSISEARFYYHRAGGNCPADWVQIATCIFGDALNSLPVNGLCRMLGHEESGLVQIGRIRAE
jgi:hypothetical protein